MINTYFRSKKFVKYINTTHGNKCRSIFKSNFLVAVLCHSVSRDANSMDIACLSASTPSRPAVESSTWHVGSTFSLASIMIVGIVAESKNVGEMCSRCFFATPHVRRIGHVCRTLTTERGRLYIINISAISPHGALSAYCPRRASSSVNVLHAND